MKITEEEKEILLSALAYLIIQNRNQKEIIEKEQRIIENLFDKLDKYVEVND